MMGYNLTITNEEIFSGGSKTSALYNLILSYWFPGDKGYVIDHLDDNQGFTHISVSHVDSKEKILLIVELVKNCLQPEKCYYSLGKAMLSEEKLNRSTFESIERIQENFQDQIKDNMYYIICLRESWKICKVTKDEKEDVIRIGSKMSSSTCNESYRMFREIADEIYSQI